MARQICPAAGPRRRAPVGTPSQSPIGNSLFMAARVANVRIEALIGKLWPTFWALCIGLLVVTFIPAISTWLPTTLGLMK